MSSVTSPCPGDHTTRCQSPRPGQRPQHAPFHAPPHPRSPQVNAEAAKVGREAEEANTIATAVAAELERALPALQEAEAALNVITKKDISELKVAIPLAAEHAHRGLCFTWVCVASARSVRSRQG
jgi:hypothetical protein